jgi:quercetin dioxygenase-like cupin family protein
MFKRIAAVALVALVATCWSVSSSQAAVDQSYDSVVYEHELPNVPGKSIKGVMVVYPPGGFTPMHTHPKSAFVYATVLEGAIRSQVNNGPIKTYKAGESFSEMPGDVHSVSENASKSKPARLLAVFVVDSNEKNLTRLSKKH